MSTAQELYNKEYPSMQHRSAAYREGILDLLNFKESTSNLNLPYSNETPEADAWLSGNIRAHQIWAENKHSHTKITDEYCESVFDKLQHTGPVLTKDQMVDVEKNFSRNGAQTRRLGLGVLTKSWLEISKPVQNDRELAFSCASLSLAIDDYMTDLNGFIEMMSAASIRLKLSLTGREDMTELLEEAKQERKREEGDNL